MPEIHELAGAAPAPAAEAPAAGAGAAPPLGTGPAPRPMPLAAAVPAATASGAALLVAFPPYDQWWLAPVGVALLAVAVHRRRARAGAGLAALAGLVFFLPLLSWTDVDIGSLPWLLLSALQAGYLALLGAATAYASPVVDRWRAGWPLLTGLVWVGQEALRARTPFGGFPWGRLAFSQADSPLLPLAALGGAPLVSFAVALAGGLLALVAWRRWWPPHARQLAGAGTGLLAAGVVALAGLAVPAAPPPAGPTVTVAVVQGNVPRLGLDFNAQRRAVLDNHVEATRELAEQVATGARPAPDLVIWPENSSDIDPVANPDAGAAISAAADAIGAPILVGAILRGPQEGEVRNVGLVWRPGTGPGEFYAKQHPVPFAEYFPLESLLLPIGRMITDEVDRVAGFTPGQQPGVLAMGPVAIGNVICFEVAYDGLVRDTIRDGAQLLVVQTNNATFTEAEARQQLAMVRLRAVEHGRESLMASTVGISGFAAPDSRVHHATGFFTRDVPLRTLTLTSHRTVATTVGAWPELLLAGGAVFLLVTAHRLRRRPAQNERFR